MRDAPLELLDGLERHIPDAPRIGSADQGADLVLLAGQPIDDLAARAAGGTPADAPSFEHCHSIATLGQRQRRRTTGDARTDYTHIGARVALQRGPSRRKRGSGGVPAAYII